MRTATADWPTSHSKLLLIVLRGVFVSLAVFGLLRVGWIETHVVLPWTLAEAALAIRLFGVPALPIDVTLACSGADVLSLCLGAVITYPAPWRHRVTGAAGAIGLIFALNILRIGTLGRAAASPFWFETLHLYVWPAALTMVIGAYVLVWMSVSPAAGAAVTETAAIEPQRSRRLIALSGVFLLTFVALSPLYLNSALVREVAAFIAASAARILTAAGLYAYASTNVLWTAHGGFLVTEECISTPLIPLYLAAVIAYPRTWTWRALGLAAALPLFVALGIARLLVVALPRSLETQSFFIHAFYQLVAGTLIVFAAAFWRHRDKTAWAWGALGVGVSVCFVAVAGPLYLRLMTSVLTMPAVDPQSAIAFLPAFQVGLYLALWTAAAAGTGWPRIAGGLLALIAAQVAGLAALHAIMTHSVITMAVRDVRGLALAVPVLIFAAVTSRGRPRR